MKKSRNVLLVLLFAIGLLNSIKSAAQMLVYSQSFTSGVAPTTQCTEWDAFRASLSGSYTYSTLKLKGSVDPTGITCTNATVVAAIANALRTGSNYGPVSSDGYSWGVFSGCGSGCGGGSVELVAVAYTTASSCNCYSPAYNIRPNRGNAQWGAIAGYTCGAASQTMTVIFNEVLCSGTPTAGTATASTTSGCPGYSTTLSLTGQTVATGVVTQWQSSSDNTTWTTISGATNATYAATVSGATYFRNLVTCSLSSSSAATSSIFADVTATATLSGTATICQSATSSISASVAGGTWSSSNTGILTVSSTGVVTGVADGVANVVYTSSVCPVSISVTVNPIPAITSATSGGNLGNIITVAGSGSYGYSGTGGQATAANLSNAVGMCVDGSGNLYIAENGSSVVRKINLTTGIITLFAGTGSSGFGGDGGPATSASLAGVYDVAADAAGNVYIAESSNSRIRKVNTSGIISTFAGTGTWPFSSGGVGGPATACNISPTGLCVDAAGNVYTADPNNNRLWKINTSGIITVVAGNGSGSFSGDGGQATAAGMAGIFSVAADASGNLYINNLSAQRIRKIIPSGIISTIAGNGSSGFSGDGGQATAASLFNPYGMAVDATGAVFIVDYSNNRIRKVSPSGVISTVAGTGSASFSGDGGSATAANINGPRDLSVDAGGSIFFIDLNNNRVRKIISSGVNNTISVCLGANSTLTSTVSGGSWSSASTSIATVGSSGVVGGVSLGTTTISYVAPSGCIGTTTIAVNPVPAAISGASSLCSGSSATLSNSVSGGTWSSSAAGIATVGSATGIVYGVSAGSTTISYSLGTCSSTTTITILGTPVLSGTLAVCEGNVSSLSASLTGGTWSSSASSIASVNAIGVVSALAAGTSTISYVLSTGCMATTVVTVGITPGTISGASAVCVGGTISLSASSSGGVWSSSNTAVLTVGSTGVASAISGGAAIVSYTVGFCSATYGVTVDPTPYISTMSAGSSSGNIITVAGTGTYGYSGNGGMATAANLSNPIGMCVDGSGNLYLAENGSSIVRKVNLTTGIITLFAGTGSSGFGGDGGPATSASLAGVYDVAADAVGNLYIAESSNSRIRKVNTSGIISTFAGTGTWPFSGGGVGGPATACNLSPTGLAVDAVGNVYTADPNNARVWKINTSGIITVVAGNGSSSFSGDGGQATAAGMAGPYQVVADGSGNLYVNNAWANRIRKITPSGIISTIAGNGSSGYSGDGGQATAATLNNPTGIAVEGSGAVVILDYNNNRIRKISPSGIISTITGTGSAGYSGDGGPATAASINGPQDVSMDAGGNVFFIDINNRRVRKIMSTGVSGSASVCLGANSTLASTVAGGTWSSASTSIATVGATGIVGGVSLGTTIITYVSPGGCVVTTTLEVNPVPASITGVTSFCSGSSSTLSNSVSGGLWTSSSASIATVGSSSGIVYGVSAGSATISYALGSCRSTATVTIFATPVISGSLTVCEGTISSLSASLAGGTWSSSAGTVASVNASGVVSAIAAGTATISYVMSSGCVATPVVTVGISPGTVSGASAVCVGGTISFSASSSGGAWSSSNTAVMTVGSTGVASAVSGGAAIVSYTVGFCSATSSVTVNPIPFITTSSGGGTLGNIITVAGSGTYGYSGNGGMATAANLGNAMASCVDGSGNLYIAENGNSVVRKIDMTTGIITLVAGTGSSGFGGDGGPATSASLAGVYDVAVDAAGNVYIAENSNSRIRKVNTSGIISTFAGTGTWPFSSGGVGGPATSCNISPTGLCVDAAGNVYTADPNNNRLWKINTSGIITVVAGNGSGSFSGDGGQATAAGMAGIYSVAADASGNLYINNLSAQRIRKISPSGVITTIAGNGSAGYGGDGGPATSATLYNPFGVTVDASGSVYIADYSGNRVRRVSASGIMSTVAGNGSGGFSGDGGPATAATINSPNDVCVDASGNVFFNDVNNRRVRMIISGGGGSGSASVCEGATTTLGNTVPGGTWSSGATSVATVGTAGVITGVATGTATISYALAGGCFATTVVTVNPAPGSISGTANLCSGTSTTLTNATSGGTWSSGNNSVATVGAGSGVLSGVAAGTALISYRAPTGCYVTLPVTIDPAAYTVSVTGASSVCEGLTISLSTSGAGGSWSSSNASATVSTSGVVTGVSVGTSVISYSVTNSCGTTVGSRTITINAGPAPVSISGTSSLCTGTTITLSTTGSGGTWSSSSVSATVSSGGVVSGVSTGTSTISYTVSTTCGAISATHALTINAAPAAVSISGASSVCESASITLSTTGSGGVWSSSNSNATVDTSGVVAGVTPGTVTVSYTVSNVCGTAGASQTVTINPAANAGSISGASFVGIGSTITLSSSGTSGGTWSSSSANATVSGGVVGGETLGTSIISYTVTNSCGTDVATQNITVNTSGLGGISGPSSLCVGSSGTYSHGTTGGVWASSNSARATINATTGAVNGVSAGTAVISYTVSSLTVTTTLTVLATPAVINGTSVVCVGAITTLSTTSSGGSWVSEDPSIATASTTAYGIVGGVSGGTTTISYVFASGCASMRTFTVSNSPSSILGAGSLCFTQTATLSNTVSGGTWTSSNTSIASVAATTGIVRAFSTASNATISYTMPGGCRATVLIPVVNMSTAISGTASVCAGQTTVFTHTAAGGVWSSSDVAIATTTTGSGTVYAVSAGSATISYTINAGCGQTKVVTVTTSPAAISGAGGLCVGQSLSLTNTVSGGAWASSATAKASVNATSGVVSGISAGTALISYSIGTCRATASVTVSAVPGVITGATTICAGSLTTLGATPTGGTWSSSDLAVATNSGAVVTGVAGGTSVISYALGSGCFRTTTVNVSNLPGTISGASNLCLAQIITLSNAVPGGTWSSSSSAAAVGASTGIVTASGSVTGSPIIKYIMPGNCSTSVTISVVSLAAIAGGSGTICEGKTTLFTNATAGGVWSAGAPAIASMGAGSGLVTGLSAGTSVISYTLNAGCSRTTSVTVRVAPDITSGPASVCAGLTITLSNSVSGGTWSSSNTTIATVGAGTGIVGGVAASSVRAIMSYTMPGGCADTMGIRVVTLSGITGVSSVCEGQTITLYNTAPGGTWSSSNTGVASVNATSGQVFGTSAGTAIISYAIGSGCTVSKTITVNSFAQITGPIDVCAGTTITLSNPMTGGTWSSYYTTLATVDASTGVVTGVAGSGTVNTITYTIPGGCFDTARLTVNYRAPITGLSSVCEGATVHLSNARAGDGGTWSSSSTANATITPSTADVWGVVAGNTTITYLLPSGCISTYSMTVDPAPAAITGPAVVCVGAVITLSNTTAGGAWSCYYTTATIVSGSGVLTGVSGGSVPNIITYTLPTGCRDTALVLIDACARPAGSMDGAGNDVIRVIPNPNSGTFTINGQLAQANDEQLTIEVTNMLGQVVYSGSTLAVEGTINAQVQLVRNIANGMYLLSLKSISETRVFHIVVEQ